MRILIITGVLAALCLLVMIPALIVASKVDEKEEEDRRK